MKRLSALFTAVLIWTALLPALAEAEVIKLKLSHFLAASHPIQKNFLDP
ncbi:MAG: TRAP-type C4-dicarboxylate transport system substrate-binding protein [Motiliproteus sp.]|jgi:TRAP-type C4-dicarboxylate transport system substrate-binding protein